jgi:hypothetical protein
MGREALPAATENVRDIAAAAAELEAATLAAAQAHIGDLVTGFNASAGPIQDYLQAQEDIVSNQGEWVDVTVTNASALSRVNSQLAADLSGEQKSAYQDILNTVEEGSSEWLAAYSALQGDLTDAQRRELIAQKADLEASGDTIASVYTGNAEEAAAAVAAMKEAHGELIESYREVALEASLAAAQMAGDDDALRAALDYAVAIGELSQAEADLRYESALTQDAITELSEMVGAGEVKAGAAALAFSYLENGIASTAQEALNLATRFQEMASAMDEVDGRSVQINVEAPGLAGLEARISALGSIGSGGGEGSTNKSSKEGVATKKGNMAIGGPVSAGNAYLVGEQGPEVVMMGGNGTVIPNHELGGNNITINVNGGGNGRMIGAQVATAVTNALGRLN